VKLASVISALLLQKYPLLRLYQLSIFCQLQFICSMYRLYVQRIRLIIISRITIQST